MIVPEANSERWLDVTNLPGEKWKLVHRSKEHGRIYVSNAGRVKRAKFSGGRYRWPMMIFRVHLSRKNGYYRVRIGDKMEAVHRLVGKAFCPNPNGYPEIDHKNRIKTDNRAANLHWVTRKMNMQNVWTVKLRLEVFSKQNIPVYQLNEQGTLLRSWKSIKEAAAAMGVNKSTMARKSRDNGWIGVFKYSRVCPTT